MSPWAARIALGAPLAIGCAPEAGEVRNQWLVSVATDAPVPQLGDRLLVEALDDDGALACSACRRVLGAPADAWPVSFGIVQAGRVSRLRVRLYRAAISGGLDGLPSGAALIDLLGTLPDPSERTEISVVLGTSCFGHPADVASRTTCLSDGSPSGPEPVLGPSDLPEPGSSPVARHDDCRRVAPEGMVCIPGGLFVLGSPESTVPTEEGASLPEHLVRISRFLLDVNEMTVGTVRALIAEGTLSGEPLHRDPDESSSAAPCTYLGAGDGAHDDWPVNCISKPLATEVCAALGKRLPTEAEWEWAAGNLERETRYAWGNEADECDHAVIARGRESLLEGGEGEIGICRTGGLDWGPVPGGDPDDRTELGVINLSGNVSEMVADVFAEYDAPCWSRQGVLVDPRCDLGSTRSSLRGGSWADWKAGARVAVRGSTATYTPPLAGFRCAASLE